MATKSRFKGIVVCTKAQYEALATKDNDKVYMVTDDDSGGVEVVQATGTSTTAVMSQNATKTAIDTAKTECINGTMTEIVNAKTECKTYTDTRIASAIATALNTAI